jgi:transcriptional regulator with XRE-family HTH domain
VSARETFAKVLRGYRDQHGLTRDAAAEKLAVSPSLYKKIESCDRRPQSDFAARCDVLFATPGVFATLHDDVIAEPYPEWFGPRVVYEDRATVITDWEMRGIPGLLQTEAYARTVIRAGKPYVPPEVIERNVQSRLERQDILTRETPPRLWVVVAEGVLRQVVGGPKVMGQQLDHIVMSAESQGVILQVLPFSATDAPGSDGPAATFEFADSLSVAYLEGWGSGRVIEDPTDVATVATALSMIKSCALSPSDSRRLVVKIRGEIGD